MKLDDDIRELYEERAAILQHMAGYPQQKADALAMAEAESFQRARNALAFAGHA